jgi:chromate transporter
MPADPAALPRLRPTLAGLFVVFLGIAMSGFGGVLPFARRSLVERHAWLSEAEFNETLSLCQTVPGPNIVNLSVVVGSRFAGAAGAAAAAAGLIAVPVVLVLALAELWGRFGGIGHAPGAIRGLGAAAAGLVAATAAKMIRPVLADAPWSGALGMAAAFVGVALLQAPLGAVMAVAAPASVALAWRLGK